MRRVLRCDEYCDATSTAYPSFRYATRVEATPLPVLLLLFPLLHPRPRRFSCSQYSIPDTQYAPPLSLPPVSPPRGKPAHLPLSRFGAGKALVPPGKAAAPAGNAFCGSGKAAMPAGKATNGSGKATSRAGKLADRTGGGGKGPGNLRTCHKTALSWAKR